MRSSIRGAMSSANMTERNMTAICIGACLFAAAAIWSTNAQSHHASASLYDITTITQWEGVVTEYEMINPHARIHLEVTDADGNVVQWLAEGDAAAVLLRRGWTGDEVQPGDRINITGHPGRDGAPIIDWRSILLPDGREIFGGNGVPVERQRHLQELEKRRRAAREQDAAADRP